jgi:hypothetical protein
MIMANPNSRLSRIRIWLGEKITPRCDGGEGWCIDCSLNGGWTLILNVDSLLEHLKIHDPDEIVKFDMRRPD